MENPLFWHQGIFLQPQHFQLQDRYVQSLLTPYRTMLQTDFWGVGRLDIEKTIGGTSFGKPHYGEFMFPDMAYVVFPDNAVIEPRSFNESWVEEEKPLTIFIGIKKWNTSGENVTVVPDLENLTHVSTRFVAKVDPDIAPDLHKDGKPAEVKRLYYVLKLFAETEKEKLGDYSIIPLAQLVRNGDDVALSERYVPPCLSLVHAKQLHRIVKEIRDQAASRGYQLEEMKRQKGIQTAEFGTRDMVYLLALRTLNRYIPSLFHVIESYTVHPWTVYGLLRSLIGELTSFSESVNVLGKEAETGRVLLPAYDHENLWKCFTAAQFLTAQLLEEITAGPDYIFPLVYDGTFFTTDIKPEAFDSRNRFYLVLESEAAVEDVLESLITSAKLGTRETLPVLIARALYGIPMEHLKIPPQELPRRAGSIYFQIDHHDEQWVQAVKGHNIALHWDPVPPEIKKIELMIVGRN